MFDHEKLQVYGKAPQSAAVKGAVFPDLGLERAFLVETEATADKEMLRRISAMVSGFLNPERQSGRQSEGQSPQLLDSSR
jgi:hypothetical protein